MVAALNGVPPTKLVARSLIRSPSMAMMSSRRGATGQRDLPAARFAGAGDGVIHIDGQQRCRAGPLAPDVDVAGAQDREAEEEHGLPGGAVYGPALRVEEGMLVIAMPPA